MSERTDQRTREFDEEEHTGTESLSTDVTPDSVLGEDDGLESSSTDAPDEDEGGSLLGDRVSILSALVVLVPPFVAAFLVGSVPLVPNALATAVGAAIGLFAGGFTAGLTFGDGQYVEGGIAGTVVGLLAGWSLAGGFAPLYAAVGGGALAGIVVALLGIYFGHDLRDGLTRDLS